jgi:serpin B
MDFTHESARARQSINEWVESQTRHRIRDLIPANRLDRHSRLVLVNAIYLKAPWQTEFYSGATRPLPFHVQGHEPHDVPTMFCQRDLGYVHSDGFTAVSIPYSGDDLHFLILLPDARNGLQALESGMKPAVLADCAELPEADVKLYLPKFKLEPPVVELAHLLGSLGMMTSFDHPTGSANFERMAPRRANDYLCLSAVFHKAFLALDEQGTEAAAATAVAAMAAGLLKRNAAPVEVRVNHPFLFAIQHRPSGACLFLGRMADPR